MDFVVPIAVQTRRRQGELRNRFCFSVGGVTIAVGTKELQLSAAQSATLARFESVDPACDPDLELETAWVPRIVSSLGEPAFDSGGLWKLYRSNDLSVFEFTSEPLGASPYKRCLIDPAFSRGQIQMNRSFFSERAHLNPLEYPLDELLVVHRLALSSGVELHACGLVDQHGRGHVFVGHSGAGKSTTAALWAEHGATILSDDRVILREREGEIWMYGTPWHGDAGFAEPQMARVSAIYLLEHGLENGFRKVSRSQAGAELFARSFVPFYDWQMLEGALSILDRVVRKVPYAWYRFIPDNGAVEFILNGEL